MMKYPIVRLSSPVGYVKYHFDVTLNQNPACFPSTREIFHFVLFPEPF